MMAMTASGQDHIMILGPNDDGTYVVEFRTATGETLSISIPRTETAVIRHFQERMPSGLYVPKVIPDQTVKIRAEINDLNKLETALIAKRDALIADLEMAREQLSLVLISGDPNDRNAIPNAEKDLRDAEKTLNAVEDAIVRLVAKLENAEERLHESQRD